MKMIATVVFLLLVAVNTSYSGEAEERFEKGVVLFNDGRFPDAIAAFKRVIDLQHENDYAWSYLGRSYFGAGKCQDGLNAQEEAIHLNSAKEVSWVGKGNCLLCLGRTDDAVKAYEKAITLNNSQESSWYGAARCYALKVEKETAIKYLQRAIELNPKIKGLAYRDKLLLNLSNEQAFKKIIEP